MSDIAIGIDLGTSTSCTALVREGTVEVLPNAYGERIIASVVAFADDGSITVGNQAKANIIRDPRHTVHSAKRLIGRYYFSEEVRKAKAICSYEILNDEERGVRIRIREETFSLPEISAMVLREMKAIAEAAIGQPVTKAVITVPAYFNDNQRQATRDAGRIAGLEVLRILNEPTAAALAYGFGKGLTQRVAVYDLGGGTFDISVLEIADDVFEVLATCGDTFLGGEDFDDRLIDLLADELHAAEGINPRNNVYALEKLKVAAEEAKKGLSVDSEVEIRIPDLITTPDGRSLSIQRTLRADEFASLVNDLVQRTFKVCDEALQQAGVVARDLDGVVLVGGPTRLPLIRHSVQTYFQREIKADVDPDQVVAMGAAIHAASLVSPKAEAYLLDVTPLSLRIGVAGGLAETVIERNTPVPIEQKRTFTTFKDFQESVVIRVYQGESREADENELLGQFEFAGFRKARRGEVEIEVSFEINGDGIVNVVARDSATGEQASTAITLSSGLSEGELKRIIEERRTDRVQTPLEDDRSLVAAAPSAQPIGAIPLERRALALDSSPTPSAAARPPAARPAAPPPGPVAKSAARPSPDEADTAELLAYADPEQDLLPDDDDLSDPDLLDLDADELEIESEPDVGEVPEIELAHALDTPGASASDIEPADLFEPAGTDLSELPGGGDRDRS